MHAYTCVRACPHTCHVRRAVACDATRATATHRSLDALPVTKMYTIREQEHPDMFRCIRAHLSQPSYLLEKSRDSYFLSLLEKAAIFYKECRAQSDVFIKY